MRSPLNFINQMHIFMSSSLTPRNDTGMWWGYPGTLILLVPNLWLLTEGEEEEGGEG